MALISIVVPCYNVEQYIDDCLNTLVRQTIGVQNLDIILVNDASTDHTLDKLYAWEKQYPEQILVVTYERNIRQGGARNIGLQYATSEYVGFVDADDWIELDMYETLYQKMKMQGYDMVRCKCIRELAPSHRSITHEHQQDQEYHFAKKGKWYDHQTHSLGNNGELGGIWTGLYKRAIIIENELWFPEEITYEDNYWGSVLKLYVKDLYIIDKILYHYRINPNSTVTTGNSLHHLDRMEIEVAILEAYIQRGAFEDFHDQLEYEFILRYYLNTLYIIFTRFDYIPDIFEQMKNTVLYYFPDYEKNPWINRYPPQYIQLLRLLKLPRVPSIEELEKVKKAYLKAIGL